MTSDDRERVLQSLLFLLDKFPVVWVAFFLRRFAFVLALRRENIHLSFFLCLINSFILFFLHHFMFFSLAESKYV